MEVVTTSGEVARSLVELVCLEVDVIRCGVDALVCSVSLEVSPVLPCPCAVDVFSLEVGFVVGTWVLCSCFVPSE